MFYIDWMMTLIVLAHLPACDPADAQHRQAAASVSRRTQAELGDMTSRLTEKLAGARLIKAFRLENYAIDRLNEQLRADLPAAHEGGARARPRAAPLLEALAGVAVAGVIAFAYWRIASGVSTVGDFMGFVTALLLAAQPIRSLGNLPPRPWKAWPPPSASTSCSTRSRPSSTAPARSRSRSRPAPSCSTTSLRLQPRRPGSRPSANFSLDVPGGKTAALVGRSGAGKSTVINLVPRLFDVDAGRILIDGQDLRDVTLASLRKSIAIVSQEVTLFDDTIRANIALGRLGASDADIVAAAKAAAAHDFIMAQPQGYDTVIGDSGLRLSGGQRQRLALARAILKDAPILLLDEATSALDTESERLVQEALARFTRNRTTLVIAHRLSTVQRADMICVMETAAWSRWARTPNCWPARCLCAAVPLAGAARSRRDRTRRRATRGSSRPEPSGCVPHLERREQDSHDCRGESTLLVCSGSAIEAAIPKSSRRPKPAGAPRMANAQHKPKLDSRRDRLAARALRPLRRIARRGRRAEMTERFEQHPAPSSVHRRACGTASSCCCRSSSQPDIQSTSCWPGTATPS